MPQVHQFGNAAQGNKTQVGRRTVQNRSARTGAYVGAIGCGRSTFNLQKSKFTGGMDLPEDQSLNLTAPAL